MFAWQQSDSGSYSFGKHLVIFVYPEPGHPLDSSEWFQLFAEYIEAHFLRDPPDLDVGASGCRLSTIDLYLIGVPISLLVGDFFS